MRWNLREAQLPVQLNLCTAGSRLGSDRTEGPMARRPANSGRLWHHFAFQRVDQAFENQSPIRAAENRLARALRVRHQAGDVAAFIAYPGNVPERTVRVRLLSDFAVRVAVLPKDLIVGLEVVQRSFVGEVTAFTVRDGDFQQFALRNPVCERRISRERFQIDMFAAELQRPITNQRAGQQAGFAQYLEPVTDAEHEPAVGG